MNRFILALLLLTGCANHHRTETLVTVREEKPPKLASIHIIDRNGLTETISNTERLKNYENVDFLQPQPYNKVLRVFSRNENGVVRGFVTTYHPNGQVKQYLEIENTRAHGSYKEWYSNGNLKIDCFVIEGDADISLAAEKSWLFDGCAKAYSEEGCLIATIPYVRGTMEGVAHYFHPNGVIWKEVIYQDNQFSGEVKIFLDTGELLQISNYCQGVKDGKTLRYWTQDQIAAQESYEKGLLLQAEYFDAKGEKISSIENGNGIRATFNREGISELQEFRNGKLEGEVKTFDIKGNLCKLHHVKNGIKHGEEIVFFPAMGGKQKQAKLSMNWYEGKVQGLVKTWYQEGGMESQKEMSNNKVNGLATAWYREGQLMLIEEYEQGSLTKGDYYRKGERKPVSQIQAGDGVATIFDPDGNYVRKITYQHGKPES